MLIAFDLDGTLFDCTPIIRESYRRANIRFAEKTGITLHLPSQELIVDQLGKPNDEIYRILYSGLTDDQYQLIISLSEKALIEDIRGGGGVIYDGAHQLITFLHERGDTLVIASNGLRSYISAVLETNNLMRYFQPLTCLGDEGINLKDDILASYLKRYQPEKAVMIGDRDSDRKAARSNGTPFICCSFGHSGDDEIADHDALVHSLNEISSLEIIA